MKPENPSAFPIAELRDADGCGLREGQPGMTLRDYFAAQAPVTLTDAAIFCGWESLHDANASQGSTQAVLWAIMAMLRYDYADAMLSARQETRHGD